MPSSKKPAAGAKRIRKTTARAAGAKRPAKRVAAPKTAGGVASSHAAPGPSGESTASRGRGPRVRKPAGPTITIEQYVSGIACPVRQKRVLRALGLRHPHHRVVRPDNPAVRGMVNAIPHLVRIREDKREA